MAVQGFGNVGEAAARLAAAEGAKVVAVSDVRGAIHDPAGPDLVALNAHVKATRSVVGFAGAQPLSNDALLELDVDILIPAALENQITGVNAGRIRARIVAEGANGPTTPEADEILHEPGVFVIPDILCNAGGVTVSYFEWVQGLSRDRWSATTVAAKHKEIMDESFREVLETSVTEAVDLRTAAYLLAVQRVATRLTFAASTRRPAQAAQRAGRDSAGSRASTQMGCPQSSRSRACHGNRGRSGAGIG